MASLCVGTERPCPVLTGRLCRVYSSHQVLFDTRGGIDEWALLLRAVFHDLKTGVGLFRWTAGGSIAMICALGDSCLVGGELARV